MTQSLAAAVADQSSQVNLRNGRIDAIDSSAGTATVSVQGGNVSSTVGWLQSYTPIVGDNVLVAVNGQAWTILGSTDDRPAIGAPGKMVAFAQRSAAKTGVTAEVGVELATAQLKAGHRYYVTTGVWLVASTLNEVAQTAAVLKFTTDGSTPTTGSALLGQGFEETMAGNGIGTGVADGFIATTVDLTLKVLLTLRRIVGGGLLLIQDGAGGGPKIVVYDLGIAVPNTGVDQ